MNKTFSINVLDTNRGGHRLPRSIKRFLSYLIIPVVMLLIGNTTLATPYTPQNGSQVLEYLPTKLSAYSNKVERLNQQFNSNTERTLSSIANPKDLLRDQLIKAYLQEATSSGDMRYVSYAQIQLEQWLLESPDSEKARLLNAHILQYNHQFEAAIKNLIALLIDYPKNNKAWSLLVNLQLLTGNYESARASCKQLLQTSNLIDNVICKSNIMIRTGSLSKANKLLESLLPGIYTLPVQKQLWLHTSLAEIKLQTGQDKLAEVHLTKALQLAENNAVNDSYLTRLFIDNLMQNKAYDEAFDLTSVLLMKNKHDTAMIIRSAVLAKKLGYQPVFDTNKQALEQVFEVEKRRKQSRHLREQALFTLLVLENPALALTLAKQNWSKQKEAEDARILIKSALLLGDKSEIKQAVLAVEEVGFVDQRLNLTRLRDSLL